MILIINNMLIIADTIGRWILQPSEILTGIVVAVIGALYFIYVKYLASMPILFPIPEPEFHSVNRIS